MSQTEPRASHQEQVAKLNELIKDIEIAMLVTAEIDGTLRSRPMATQKRDFKGDLWFFTKDHTPKVEEIEQDKHVNLVYSAPDKQCYVSVSGTARVMRDRAKIEELWSPELKAWFPEGKDDPEIALLQIKTTQAEYWDSSSSAVVHLIGMTKAVLTGESYQPGENEKVDL